jgi:hypothetical protein
MDQSSTRLQELIRKMEHYRATAKQMARESLQMTEDARKMSEEAMKMRHSRRPGTGLPGLLRINAGGISSFFLEASYRCNTISQN